MKWKTPTYRDVRVKTGFSLLPVRCADGVTVLLRQYWMVEQWSELFECWRIESRHSTRQSAEDAASLIRARYAQSDNSNKAEEEARVGHR